MTWMCDSHIPCIAHIPHIPSPSHVGPMRTWQQMCGILTPSVCDLKFQISGTTSPIDSQHMAWMMIWIYRSFPSAMQWVVKSEHNQNTLFWTWVWWDRWNPRFFGSTWNSENVGTFWPIDLFVLLFDLCAFVRCLSLTNLTKLIVTGCECLPGGLEARSDPKTCYTRRWRYKMDVFQTLFPWVWMIYMVWSTVGFKLIWLFHALFCGFVSVCFCWTQERGHGLGMFVDLGQYGSQCFVANGTVPFALGQLGGWRKETEKIHFTIGSQDFGTGLFWQKRGKTWKNWNISKSKHFLQIFSSIESPVLVVMPTFVGGPWVCGGGLSEEVPAGTRTLPWPQAFWHQALWRHMGCFMAAADSLVVCKCV